MCVKYNNVSDTTTPGHKLSNHEGGISYDELGPVREM